MILCSLRLQNPRNVPPGQTAPSILPHLGILALKNSVFKFGLVVTNTRFTADAKWIAAQCDNKWFVKLRDFEAIKAWLENTFDYGEEEMPSTVEIAPGIEIEIPKA